MAQIIFLRHEDGKRKEVFRVRLNGKMLLTVTGGDDLVWETDSTTETLRPGETIVIKADRNGWSSKAGQDAWGVYPFPLDEFYEQKDEES